MWNGAGVPGRTTTSGSGKTFRAAQALASAAPGSAVPLEGTGQRAGLADAAPSGAFAAASMRIP
jgi:hypothetical protein